MRVVLEAGCHANWIYRLLERLGHEPLMADTHRLALIIAGRTIAATPNGWPSWGCGCPRC